MTLKWEAKDRWWTKIVMGTFEYVYIRDGDGLYISGNTGITPVQIRDLINLLHFGGDLDGARAKKQEKRVEEGLEMACLQVQAGDNRGETRMVCVSGATHEILSEELRDPPDGRRSESFADYAEFGRHRYPRKLRLRMNGVTELAVDVTGLTTIAFDPSWLVAPEGAIYRRQCAGMLPAVPIKTPQPGYPQAAIQSTMIGDTTVSLTVLPDGSVGEIGLIGRASQWMDEATLKTRKGWRFNPACCGAESIVSDFVVMESFRLLADNKQIGRLTTRYFSTFTTMEVRTPSEHYFPLTSWHELRQSRDLWGR
jgi:hypothetical protein